MDAKEIELGEPLQLIWDATLEICPEKVRAASERPDPQAASASQSSQGAMPPDVGQDKSGAGQGVWGPPGKEPPQRPKDEEGDVGMAGPEEDDQEEEDEDFAVGNWITDHRSPEQKIQDLDWMFQSQYDEAMDWERGERIEFGDKIQAERRDKVNKDQLDKIVTDCQYRGNVPRCWLEVLKDEMLASRTAHVPHDAGGFIHVLRCTYNHLPIRYTRMLHDIIWEQTNNYLAGGLRGLNGLSHPLAPQNIEREEFFKREEDRWKMGECIQNQEAKDSLK